MGCSAAAMRIGGCGCWTEPEFRLQVLTNNSYLMYLHGIAPFVTTSYTGTASGVYTAGGWSNGAASWTVGKYAKRVEGATVTWWVCIASVSGYSSDPAGDVVHFEAASEQSTWKDTYYVGMWQGVDDFATGDFVRKVWYDKTGGVKASKLLVWYSDKVNAGDPEDEDTGAVSTSDGGWTYRHISGVLRDIRWSAAYGFRIGYCYGGMVVEERDGETVIGTYECISEFDPNSVASRPSTDTSRWRSTTLSGYVVYRVDWSGTNKYCPEVVNRGDVIYISGSGYWRASVDMTPGEQESETYYDLTPPSWDNSSIKTGVRTWCADKVAANGANWYIRGMLYDRSAIVLDDYVYNGVTLLQYPTGGGIRYHSWSEKTRLAVDGGSTYTEEIEYRLHPSQYRATLADGALRYFCEAPTVVSEFGVMDFPAPPADAVDDDAGNDVATYDADSGSWDAGAPASFSVGDMCSRVKSGEPTRRLMCSTGYVKDATDPATNGKWTWERYANCYRNVKHRVPYNELVAPIPLGEPDGHEATALAQRVTHEVEVDWYDTHAVRKYAIGQFSATASDDMLSRSDGKPHGYNHLDQVYVGGSSLPGGVVEGQVYYVSYVDDFRFKLFARGIVDITSDGTCYLTPTGLKYCVVDADEDVIYCKGHGIESLRLVTVVAGPGATLPGGLTARYYYARVIDDDTIQLLVEPYGETVDITSSGSGVLGLMMIYWGSPTTSTKQITVEQEYAIDGDSEFGYGDFAQACGVAAWNNFPESSLPTGSSKYPRPVTSGSSAKDSLLGRSLPVLRLTGVYTVAWYKNGLAQQILTGPAMGDDCTSIDYQDGVWHQEKIDPRQTDFVGVDFVLGSTCAP